MDDILDLIATDQKASEITDKIKDVLYAKSGAKIDSLKPNVALNMFDPTIVSEPEASEEEEISKEEPGEEE